MGKTCARLRLPILAEVPARPGAGYVLAPWLKVLPAGNSDLLSLLPVADINRETLSAAARISNRTSSTADGFAALLLADPFLRLRDAASLLRRAGVAGVANFPTTQIVDGETARVFESAGARASREIAMLTAFAQEGFATAGFACGVEAASDMARSGPTIMVLHPGVALADWRQRAAAALVVARAVEAVRALTDSPVVVYRPAGFGAELDQAIASADGEARIGGRETV